MRRVGSIYFIVAALCVSHAIAKDISFTEVRIPVGERHVRIDLYQPNDVRAGLADNYGAAGQKPHRTILLLYGAGGLAFDGSRMRITAQQWVRDGNIVYLVHYLDGTGGFMAMPWSMRSGFDEWVETVRYAIDWIQKQPSSSGPIGIYSYSLGAFVGLEAASDNPQVGALVDFAGGWVEGDMKPLGRMPPLLLVHGQRDHRVPYKKYVLPLFTYLNQRNIPYESRVFPTQGHKFKPGELEEVRTQAMEFFQQHLKPGPSRTGISLQKGTKEMKSQRPGERSASGILHRSTARVHADAERSTPNTQPRKSGFAAHAVNSLLRESLALLRSPMSNAQ